MKSYLLVLAALALGTVASPMGSESQGHSPNEVRTPLIEPRDCKHQSSCSWFNAGKCETYCAGHGGFDVMKACYFGKGACCCNKN